jgi:hypothetical protein
VRVEVDRHAVVPPPLGRADRNSTRRAQRVIRTSPA